MRIALHMYCSSLLLLYSGVIMAYNDDNAAYYGNNDDQNQYDTYKRVNDDFQQDQQSGNMGDDGRLAEDFSYKGESGFNAVSLMPVSCLNLYGGHMIKFELFENNNSYQCHFKNLGSYVVSVAHYMRAYFNYQFVVNGDKFSLPNDAGYLTCVQLDETMNSNSPLYAKIGCQEKETLVSTRLQLYLYTDNQCSVPYSEESNGSFSVNGYSVSNKVSFRPPFYTCNTCTPSTISSSFTKQSQKWYDDDMINANGQNQVGANVYYDDDNDDDDNDDNSGYSGGNDDNKFVDDFWKNQANINYDYFNGNGGRRLDGSLDEDNYQDSNPRTLKDSNSMIIQEAKYLHRNLAKRGVGNWNMCDRLWRYGAYCDEECRALDTFRVDEWSSSDIFLLIVMCLFMASMMLLVVAKRVKAYERASIYGDDMDIPYPGLPPMAMFLVFVLILSVILVLANLKLVNETLLFAVVTCIILFMYMLKLTLFESRGPMLLPAAHRHSAMNSMNRQLYD